VGVHVGVGQQPELFELVGAQEVGFVQDQDDGSAAFVFLGSEQFGGLGDEGGLVESGDATECGDDSAVEAAAADGGVAQLDGGVS
jgi:hypothetical protein